MNTCLKVSNLFLVLCLCLASHSLGQEEEAKKSDSVRIFDPVKREFVPIDPVKVEPGKIYNHYSDRHGEYVWAYAKGDGKFSYALGPGTLEMPTNVALTTTPEETDRLLEERGFGTRDPRRWYRTEVRIRMDGNQEWQVLEQNYSSNRSHFDLDSHRRWEWHGDRRIPVRHTGGDTWRYDDGRYVPEHPWLGHRW